MLIQTYILHGKAVASANNHRMGHGRFHPSSSYDDWKKDAIAQLDAQIKASGHDVGVAYDVKFKERPGRKPKKVEIRRNTNPIFTKDLVPTGYYITLWYYHPKYTYERDEAGQVVNTTKGQPKRKPFIGDYDNIIKGVYDALQGAGAIDNDKHVRPGPVHPKILPNDKEPFVCILIEPAEESSDCPFLPVDQSLYMPRVYPGASEWSQYRKQEIAFDQYKKEHGIVEVPRIAKCRCSLCHIFIGQGYIEQEIYAHWGATTPWVEERWQNKVVMICGGCARNRMETDVEIQETLKAETIAWLKEHGVGNYEWDNICDSTAPGFEIYKEAQRLLKQTLQPKLREMYTKYRLASSEEIGSISWKTIEERRKGMEHATSANTTSRRSHKSGKAPRTASKVSVINDGWIAAGDFSFDW